ncbi:HipA domain-containing protein [Thalassospira xiamenensis]|uniref:HipA domain-containing protein n=1 Tax=Thalassospira xiamenensis TaxID=220697 RepID=UPI003AA901D9
MTRRLDVYLEGVDHPIGQLLGKNDKSLTFAYGDDAVRANMQLSISMPAAQGTFTDHPTRGFFANLLQENNALEQVMAKHRIDRDDIAGLLYHVGRDCPGAISCVPSGEKPSKMPGNIASDYDAISNDDLGDILISLRDRRRLPDGKNDPSPLAGVQGKIAVTRLEDGQFALPKPGSGAPTTHILKVPSQGNEALVAQEAALMALAARVLPLPVAHVGAIEIAGCEALLIERFDRKIEDGNIYRIHQEDFCQALSLAPSLKYERNGTEENKFSAIGVARVLDETEVPLIARQHFMTLSIFNLVVGNTDNHAKNHAILYPALGHKPILAPAYDIIPVVLDRSVTHDFSFNIGQAEKMEDLTAPDIAACISAIGLARTMRTAKSRDRYFDELGSLLQTAEDNLDMMEGPSLKACRDMISQNIATVAETLDVPVKQQSRDSFVAQGGGWGMGS